MKRPALFVAAIILVLCAIAACGSGDESDSNGPGGPEERTEFSVVMTDPGSNKVEVIKAIREITGLGLKEAKGMVEVVPCHVADGVSASDADAIRRKLESAGARVEIR